MSDLAKEHARIQKGLVSAMQAAQTWHDMMQAAEAMISVNARFSHMWKEWERQSGDNGQCLQSGLASSGISAEEFTNATELERDSILIRRPNGGLG